MAKYVTLSFEDDESASKFVESVQRDAEVFTLDAEAWGGVSNDHTSHIVEVVAMYKKPTRFCDCDVTRPFTRGSKYGWWVHAIRGCMSPTLTWVKNRLEMREYNELKEVD